jgi:pyruvate kinase
MANLHAIMNVVSQLIGEGSQDVPNQVPVDFDTGPKLIAQRTRQLFGTAQRNRGVHIMVTMPSEAADSYSLISDLVAGGMDCMRINCAHDDERVWLKMIENLRRAERELGRKCHLFMDLGGPKLRTGHLGAVQSVLKWKPTRDTLGRVLVPARVWLTPDAQPSDPPVPADVIVRVVGDWLNALTAGQVIRFVDARGRKRIIRVMETMEAGIWGESGRSAYLTADTRFELYHSDGQKADYPTGRIGLIQPPESFIVVSQGNRLNLCDAEKRGGPARYDDRGRLTQQAHIGCTLPEVFADLKQGQRILFDDGQITGRIVEAHPRHALVEIMATRCGGGKLRPDKGINLPDTDLSLAALTPKDVHDLEFIVQHADMVGYSFVRRPEDIRRLQAELDRLGKSSLPIVLKIENRQAFTNLTPLLLAAMRSPLVGVMIARGDLAVECGWERLAEVQEEILWMCEAAHVPVVWATQVLEGLAKEGIPTRAEITDAAMSVRAECVMLNKGPHILKALQVLDDILKRMRDHQTKKRPLLRRLRVADNIWPA